MSLKEIFENKYEREKNPNPHHKSRPSPPDGIIIHSMGQRIKGYGYASDFLKEIELSAHYLVETDGKTIELVHPDKQAYHAGESQFKDQIFLNSTFIGIEVLVEGEHTYPTFLEEIKKEDTFYFKQIDSCATLCALLCDQYDISIDRILRHSDVSGPDVRDDPKFDPGDGFKWDSFKELTGLLLGQLEES